MNGARADNFGFVIDGVEYPFQIADVNIGILYIFGVVSIGVYGIMIGGWASNNKYSFLGGLRSTAQMVSYESAVGLIIISVLVTAGSANLSDLVRPRVEHGVGQRRPARARDAVRVA